MLHVSANGVLLDIEGTTSSIQFVYEVMFPFVRRELGAFLSANWKTPSVREACQVIGHEAGHESLEAMCGDDANEQAARQRVADEVIRLMDADAKTTGLKMLQGMIWQSGFESGELQAHLFDDVPAAMRRWREQGLGLRIYSSGSVTAQRLFFGHTVGGDLSSLIDAHYDTTTGPKRESASYTAIAQDWGLPAGEILFLSDVPAELDAARSAGFQTALCCRPGNAGVPAAVDHLTIISFADVCITPYGQGAALP